MKYSGMEVNSGMKEKDSSKVRGMYLATFHH